MAKCAECGRPAGFFGGICQDCKNEREKRERKRREAQAAEEAERQRREEEHARQLATDRANSLRDRCATGTRMFLYESVYIPVNSRIDDQEVCPSFDIDQLRELGLEGWEIVQVVPRTMGMSLINKNLVGGISTGVDAYAGGIGGTVIGVHVILRLEANPAHPPSMAALVAFAASHPTLSFTESGGTPIRA